MRIETTRGAATAPAWEYTLDATAVRITRVAVASSAAVTVVPPPWDPYDSPAGLRIESATTTVGGKRLTVSFTGAAGSAAEPCGADYIGEAVEGANAVIVIVNIHSNGGACPDIGYPRTTTVELAGPLGDRAVLEVVQGLPVPVTMTT
jgi:hypothetical protein